MAQLAVTTQLQYNKMPIGEIQETHIPSGRNYKCNGYRIITSAATKSNGETKQGLHIGGAAVVIHESLGRHIAQIRRTDHRIIKNNPTSQEYTNHCHHTKHILNRIKETERKWNIWHKYKKINQIPRKQITIWCADANAQIGKMRTGEAGNTGIIWPYAKK